MNVFQMLSWVNNNPEREKVEDVRNLVKELFQLDREAVAKFPGNEVGYIEYRKSHTRIQEIIEKLKVYEVVTYDLFDSPHIDTESDLYIEAFGEYSKISDIEQE